MNRRVTASVLTALAYVVGLCLGAPTAGAVPAKKLDNNLAAMWTTILQTPSAQNPFGSGGPAFGCWNLGGTVAPFGPSGVASCTVKPGTKIFVAATSAECSTFRWDWAGSTEAELRACAAQATCKQRPPSPSTARSVPVTEVETTLLNIALPADNIFGVQPSRDEGQSVAHGWVTLLNPLTPGTHTIGLPNITTTIDVKPGLN